MDRRRFVLTSLAGAIATPLAAEAQQAGKVYRVGILETLGPQLNAANLDAFRHGLRELGYLEGRNLTIEYRSAEGRSERFPELATELVRLRVDLIVTRGTPAALAAKNATATIPVVMASIADPVGSGVIATLARPGGNVTGLSAFVVSLLAKRLEVLRELIPRLARIAALWDMGNPSSQAAKEIEAVARSVGVQPQLLDVRTPTDIERAFDAAVRQRADGLIVGLSAVIQANQRHLIELAAKHRLPAMYFSRDFVDAGGLVSYGVSYPDLYRRAASYVDKIFRGAKPADLPIEQPTKFELVMNLKTAKALSLTIPPSLLARADQVVE